MAMKIREFKRDCKFSKNGLHTLEYSKGEQIEVDERRAKIAEDSRIAKIVGDVKTVVKKEITKIEEPKEEKKATKASKVKKALKEAPENK